MSAISTSRSAAKPRYVFEDRCTGCGQCTEVCPVSIPNEFDEHLSERKAIYRFFPQAVPITFCIDKKDRAPCVITCPAGLNVQGYVQLIGQGKYLEAVQLIMRTGAAARRAGKGLPASLRIPVSPPGSG